MPSHKEPREEEVMPRTLYVAANGQPSRAVLMMIEALGLDDIVIKSLKMNDGEHLTDWFTKINPRHCLPTLDDDGFILWESRTILRYLADSAPSGESVYPKDLKKRALVDRALDEDATYLFKFVTNYTHPIILMGLPGDQDTADLVHRYLDFLDRSLENKTFVTGKDLSIADFSTLSLVTLLELTDFDISRHTHIVRWVTELKSMSFYKISEDGLKRYRENIQSPAFKMMQEKRRQTGNMYSWATPSNRAGSG